MTPREANAAGSRRPRLTFVLLSWNEEANIAACLASLARQGRGDFEVVLIDAGSTDRTVEIAQRARRRLPFDLTIRVGQAKMPIGAARNLGVAIAKAPLVAFLSADAELEPGWVTQALLSLRDADMAFGPQLHAPHRWTLGAAVRGLRYRFPEGETTQPLQFASNVAAAYRKGLLQAFPFDGWANAAEDILLARRASAAGYRAAYNPLMRVRHHDVESLRQEMRKNVREGRGCGLYAKELGVQWERLAWLLVLGLAAAALLVSPIAGSILLVVGLWLPALRRAVRRRLAMPLLPLVAGVAASPLFDLAFLAHYIGGLTGAWRVAP